MNILKSATILLISVLSGVNAQISSNVIGFGSGSEIYSLANQNPLNKTRVSFSGFNLSADPASTANASTGLWTWNAGLSIINAATNETNYPLSSAANSTTNVINVAYTLDFPGGQLPQQNDTNWTICANIIHIPWTSAVLRRAPNDPGDCSVVLGQACVNRIRNRWRGPSTSSIGCPSGADFTSFPECESISTNGYSYGSSSIMSYLSDPNNKNSSRVGLKSGQIFSYEAGRLFNASQAQAEYNKGASQLRMMIMTFAPSKAFISNHSGTLNSGEVRTFCSILNTKAPVPNVAPRLSSIHRYSTFIAAWTICFIWKLL